MIQEYLAPLCGPGTRVLQSGCADGREVCRLRQAGAMAFGVDWREAQVREAQRLHPGDADCFSVDSLPSLAKQASGEWDVVVALDFLAQIPSHQVFESALRLSELLQPKGNLVLSIAAAPRPRTGERDSAAAEGSRDYPLGELILLLQRAGLVLVTWTKRQDEGSQHVGEWTHLHLYNAGTAKKPVRQVETVIHLDPKTATYKLALLRALCDLARSAPRMAEFLPGDRVSVPVGLIASRWIRYYWHLVDSGTFIPQIKGEHSSSKKPIAFRAPLHRLVDAYRPLGGLPRFCTDIRTGLPETLSRAFLPALQKVVETIVKGPLRYTLRRSPEGAIFAYEKRTGRSQGRRPTLNECSVARMFGRILLPADLWSKLLLIGHWIEESLILRWAEYTNALSDGDIPVFDAEAKLMLWRPGADPASWKDHTWAGLVEAVEATATSRGLLRWNGDVG